MIKQTIRYDQCICLHGSQQSVNTTGNNNILLCPWSLCDLTNHICSVSKSTGTIEEYPMELLTLTWIIADWRCLHILLWLIMQRNASHLLVSHIIFFVIINLKLWFLMCIRRDIQRECREMQVKHSISYQSCRDQKKNILYIISISYNNFSKEEAWLTFHLCLHEQIYYSFCAPSQMIDETLSICLYNFKLKDYLHHFGIMV